MQIRQDSNIRAKKNCPPKCFQALVKEDEGNLEPEHRDTIIECH